MFYHSNGKLTVFAPTRCGNTNMYYYFDIPIYSLIKSKIELTDDLVIVIRNPIDRMISAVKGFTPKLHKYTPDATWTDLSILAGNSDHEIREKVLFYWHSKPYMSSFEHGNFRIIDFYKLDKYVPRNPDPAAPQSPITYTTGLTNPKEHYVENSIFSLADLEKEYDLYLQIMNTREQISVEEWKSLTP